MSQTALGIDIGGTGIKAALVDLATGHLLGEKQHMLTPQPATPQAIAAATCELRDRFAALSPDVPIGVAIPAVVRRGTVRTCANIDPLWKGTDGDALFAEALGRPVTLLNDADAAGLAEMQFGAGHGQPGTVAVITLGTGIGSALFVEGRMMPRTELGHLEHGGIDCCNWAAAAAMNRESLSWDAWIDRVQQFLSCFESLLWPDVVIIGGAISADADRFLPRLHLDAEIVPAGLRGDAGVVGAALAAAAAIRGSAATAQRNAAG